MSFGDIMIHVIVYMYVQGPNVYCVYVMYLHVLFTLNSERRSISDRKEANMIVTYIVH